MTTNLREWRHILKLRIDEEAHPQMSDLVFMIYCFFKDKLPVIVEDIDPNHTQKTLIPED
ncbi:MAG: hypothetical protein K6G55_00460 [Selenomonadaceae bacterium]|nr:hypothetical protein [Selenomonadaceae bacterium]